MGGDCCGAKPQTRDIVEQVARLRTAELGDEIGVMAGHERIRLHRELQESIPTVGLENRRKGR